VRVRVVLGVALALVGVAVAVTLSQRGERLAGTSFVQQRAFLVVVPPRGEACQPGTLLSDDSAAAELLVGTYGQPRPALALTFRDADRSVVARGRVAGGRREGTVVVPFARAVEGNRAVRACVRNEGRDPVALAGDIAPPPSAARIGGRPAAGVVGFRYLRAGRESWWSLMPVIAQRFGLGKAGLFGTWTLPACALLLVGLWLATARLLLRAGEEER
jgi:hypothetical protein